MAKDNVVVKYFVCELSSQVAKVLDQKTGGCEALQTFEALAAVVALRTVVEITCRPWSCCSSPSRRERATGDHKRGGLR